MKTLTVERTIGVPFEKAWAIAADFVQSPGPSFSVQAVKEGDPEKSGAGAERIISMKGSKPTHERLESVGPRAAFTYSLLSGAPVKSYLGTVKLDAIGDKTNVLWKIEFVPKFPGTGGLICSVVMKVINQYIDDVEKSCSR